MDRSDKQQQQLSLAKSSRQQRNNEWIFRDVPSDITIQVNGGAFSLHKFPLVSRSGRIRKLVAEHRDSDISRVELLNLPGGAESFELAAKFCYGINFEITSGNVAQLCCASDYLEMTEEFSKDNLGSRAEEYLECIVCKNLEMCVEVLLQCESLLPLADELKIVSRCIDAIASKACVEQIASSFSRLEYSSSGRLHMNRQAKCDGDWWIEDLSVLRVDLYQRVITAMKCRGVRPESIGASLVNYAQKELTKKSSLWNPSGQTKVDVIPASTGHEKLVVETIVGLLPVEKLVVPITFLFGLLRSAVMLDCTIACRLDLERRIGSQLDIATLDDLLIPSFKHAGDTLFDVDTVHRILVNFSQQDDSEEDMEDGSVFESDSPHSPSQTALFKVSKLLDNYLAEIAPDANLKLAKFLVIADALPEHARTVHDGLYRAIDIYLKAHQGLSVSPHSLSDFRPSLTTMAAATPRRIFPINDWAPAQEAMYAESSSSSTSALKSHPFPDQHEVSAAREPRLRSLSMSLPWRHRPKSSVFHFDDLEHKFHDLALDRTRSHNLETVFDNEIDTAAGVQGHDKGKKSIGGMIRRASVSLKGFVHRRTSIATSTGEDHDHHETRRQFLRTSHAHSHTLSHNPFATAQPHARPTTSHSTWHRLRQAASFRHSRVLYGEHLDQAGLSPPREDSPDAAPPNMSVPVPGSGNEPPIIPHNTGSGARAAAAAWQSEYHGIHGLTIVSPKNKWLSPGGGEDGLLQNDQESGIGIAVTTSADSDIAGDDEMQDLDLDLDLVTSNGEEILGCAPEISRIDFVSRLPTELAIQILAHLDATALGTASLVSRFWHNVVSNQHIWRESFLREKTVTYATSRPVQPGAGLGVPSIQIGNNWREIYRVKEELDSRWKEGKATPVYLNGHSDSIYCLQFDEEKIITGSRDKTIRIWDMRTMECKLVIGPPEVVNETSVLYDENGEPTHYATYENTTPTTEVTPATRTTSVPAIGTFPMHHKASILCLQYDENILVTGSSDSTCIVYNVKSGYRPIRRLRHHSAAVLDLCFDERHIVTCSKDISICVWDRATGALLKQLRGHSGPVNAVQMRGNTIVSCSGDFRVKLWNIDTGKNFREFQGHTKGLACSQFSEDGRYVASAGNDKVIRIWDANTGECLREMKAHDNLVRSLHIDSVSGRLVSGSYDTDIKVFDMESGRQLLDFPKWHASWVLSAKSDYRRIVSTGQDPKILVMDFGAGVEGIEMLESSTAPPRSAEARITAIAEEDENYI